MKFAVRGKCSLWLEHKKTSLALPLSGNLWQSLQQELTVVEAALCPLSLLCPRENPRFEIG